MARILGFLIAAACLVGLLLYSRQADGPVVVSGFVEADEIRVGSRVGGRVQSVAVEEGQQVAKGETLIVLDPFDLLERKAEAQQDVAQAAAVHDKLTAGYRPEEVAQSHARLKQFQADLQRLKNGPRPQEIEASRASLRLAEAELELARKIYQRTESLYGRDAIDKNTFDEVTTQLSVAQSTVDARTEQLQLLQEGSRQEDIDRAAARVEEAEQQLALMTNGYREEEVREASAKRQAAEASMRAIERQLDELNIVSPTDAVVEAIELQPGDLIAPGAPAVSLVDMQRLWVRTYVPEDRLNLQNGQQLSLRVDSFADRTFTGEIVFVARQAEFTPGNVQTPEERSKQVFRVKVLLQEGQDVLRPGMAADVILPKAGGTP